MEGSALYTLRPLGLGELLDQAVRLYRRNFLTFVGIVALVYIPYALMQVVSSGLLITNTQIIQSDPESIFSSAGYWLSLLGSLAAALVYVVFVLGLGTAAVTNAVARNYMGQKTGILEAYKSLGASSYNLLLTLILFGLLWFAAFIWTIVPCVGWLTGPGLLVFMGGIVGQLVPSTVVIEKLGGFKPISRAWDLARRRFWWLIGFAVIFYLFNLLVVSGPTALVNYLTVLLIGHDSAYLQNIQLISTLVSTIAGSVIHLVILPIQLTAWTLVYFDLRVRTEGFDLALLTLGTAESANVEISNLQAPAPEKPWLTGEDVGKFVAISLIGIGIYALLVSLVVLLGLGISSLTHF